MGFQRKLRIVVAVAAAAGLFGAAPSLAGNIAGTIKYEGDVPNLKPVQMDADPGCAKKHATPPKSEMLVLGSGNTLANVLVVVRKGLPQKEWPAPKDAAVLDQDGCRYVPHVLAVQAGQPIKILNSDGLLHNVHALPEVNASFNQAMPASVTEAVKTFSKPEPPFKIKCDVHPWMGAWVAVFEHPFFSVTGPDGKFSISGLPPGTYEIEAWHEKLPAKTATATIKGDETQSIDFSFSPPPRG